MDDLWVLPLLTNHVDFAVKLDSSHPKQRDPKFGGLHDPPAGGVFLQDLRGGCQSIHSPSTSHKVRLNSMIFRANFKYFLGKLNYFYETFLLFSAVYEEQPLLYRSLFILGRSSTKPLMLYLVTHFNHYHYHYLIIMMYLVTLLWASSLYSPCQPPSSRKLVSSSIRQEDLNNQDQWRDLEVMFLSSYYGNIITK